MALSDSSCRGRPADFRLGLSAKSPGSNQDPACFMKEIGSNLNPLKNAFYPDFYIIPLTLQGKKAAAGTFSGFVVDSLLFSGSGTLNDTENVPIAHVQLNSVANTVSTDPDKALFAGVIPQYPFGLYNAVFLQVDYFNLTSITPAADVTARMHATLTAFNTTNAALQIVLTQPVRDAASEIIVSVPGGIAGVFFSQSVYLGALAELIHPTITCYNILRPGNSIHTSVSFFDGPGGVVLGLEDLDPIAVTAARLILVNINGLTDSENSCLDSLCLQDNPAQVNTGYDLSGPGSETEFTHAH